MTKPTNNSKSNEQANSSKKGSSGTNRQRQVKPPGVPWGIFVVDLCTRFGIGGGLIIVVTIVFLVWGTATQKQAFIDRYILLKWPKGEEGYPFFVLGLIVVLVIMNWMFYHRKMKLKDERIKILTEDLQKYQ